MPSQLTQKIQILAGLTSFIVAISITGLLVPALAQLLALQPRDAGGLFGILTMPLVHGSFSHLALNLPPFIVLAALILLKGATHFFFTTAIVVILGGVLLWLFGQPGLHIGASGLVFGYLGYLLADGYYNPKLQTIGVALAVAFVYGGLLWGILPNQPGVSWDGHLAGLAAGIISAKIGATSSSRRA